MENEHINLMILKVWNIKSYKLKISDLSRRYLAFVEQYKAISFIEKNLLVKEVIEKISPFIEGIGIIFGSYAKGTSGKESDLDIFIAGNYEKEEVKKVSINLGIDISVKCYPLKTFEKNINQDILMKLSRFHFIPSVVSVCVLVCFDAFEA